MTKLINFSIRHPYPHEEGQTIYVREQSWLSAYSNIFSQSQILDIFKQKKRKSNLSKR